MADERLDFETAVRLLSILVASSKTVTPSYRAISFNADQNSSSRLTLVLCPAMSNDRLRMVDFMRASCSREDWHQAGRQSIREISPVTCAFPPALRRRAD